LDATRQLSQLLTLVQSCRAHIAENQATFDEYDRWCKIRSNIERRRTDLQSSSPDPGSVRRQEFESQIAEIQSMYVLANYKVVRSFDAVSYAKACLGTVHKERQRLSQSLLIDPRWAQVLAEFKGDDLEELEQRLTEMLHHHQGGHPTTRTQNPSLSARRTAFREDLTGELSNIKIQMERGLPLAEVRAQYPNFAVWKLIDEHGYQNDLERPEFRPKQLAATLTKHQFQVSQSTLEKDRKQVRKQNKETSR
jgi:hypothetical protein